MNSTLKMLVLTALTVPLLAACSGYQNEDSMTKDQHISNQTAPMPKDMKRTASDEVDGHPMAPYTATCEGKTFDGCYVKASDRCSAQYGFGVYNKEEKLGKKIINFACLDSDLPAPQ